MIKASGGIAWLAAFGWLGLAATAGAAGPPVHAPTAPTPPAGPITLRAEPAISPGVAAFPRLVAGPDNTAAARINRALAQGDQRVRQAAAECPADKDSGASGWARTVSVTMRGPSYLSLIAADDYYCGGPYPDTSRQALVYDRATGAPVNWSRLLPKAMVQGTIIDSVGDGTRIGAVKSRALHALYTPLARADGVDPECADVLADPEMAFMLWPDAKAGGLGIEPFGLVHAVAACGPPAVIPMAELRKAGVRAELLDAIDVAHTQGLFGP